MRLYGLNVVEQVLAGFSDHEELTVGCDFPAPESRENKISVR